MVTVYNQPFTDFGEWLSNNDYQLMGCSPAACTKGKGALLITILGWHYKIPIPYTVFKGKRKLFCDANADDDDAVGDTVAIAAAFVAVPVVLLEN